ncbi:MAG: hypothetical protein M3Q97_04920 [Bacteroidota bacterium]|nr:hypothetical protein [Bacteroidota bacterium]
MKRLTGILLLSGILCLPLLARSQARIVSITPSAVTTGSTQHIIIKARDAHFGQATVVDLGEDVEVVRVDVRDTETLVATIRVLSTAASGFRDVIIITGPEIINYPGRFEVVEQGAQILVSLEVLPVQIISLADLDPPGPNGSPLLFSVTINNDAAAHDFRIEFFLQSTEYGSIARATKWLPGIQPYATVAFDNRSFDTYKDHDMSTAAARRARQTATLPASQYIFRIEVYDERNIRIGEAEEVLTLTNLTNKPELISPGVPMEAPLEAINDLHPLFIWYSQATVFDFALYTVDPGQNSAQSVVMNRPVYRQENITESRLLYPQFAELLTEGQIYAWQVVAKTQSSRGEALLPSEVFWFRYSATTTPSVFVSSLKIEPGSSKVFTGDSLRFNIVALNPENEKINIKPRWQVVPAHAGSIDKNGLFKAGPNSGTAAILAEYDSLQEFIIVTIIPSAPVTDP